MDDSALAARREQARQFLSSGVHRCISLTPRDAMLIIDQALLWRAMVSTERQAVNRANASPPSNRLSAVGLSEFEIPWDWFPSIPRRKLS